MQAGESLSFINLPDELSVREQQAETERDLINEEFVLLHRRLLERHGDVFDSIEVQEDLGTVTVTEGSFQLLFSDGSYLHVVSYAHCDTQGPLDIGLSIVEHTSEGKYLGGYLYEFEGAEGVRYSRQYANEDEDEYDEEAHFSVIEMHRQVEQYYQMQLSEDESIRSLAEIVWHEVEEAVALGAMEKDLGFSLATPTLEDIKKLRALIDLVSPFERVE